MRSPTQPSPLAGTKQRLISVLQGEALWPPPVWLMRQAGRYLPEYREVRASVSGFLELCYTPALAAEVTLQPIRRYGFDAAILFSDILVIPDALGQRVRFLEGEGPRLDPIGSESELARLDLAATDEKFSRVYETVQRLRQDLPRETALIGFCGAPWTVATYMVGGEGSSDQAAARSLAYRDPQTFARLIDIVTAASIDYLDGQVRAGADALQIFDSWAGNLPDGEFANWVVAPTRRIVAELQRRHPQTPIIGFPRGAGANAESYVRATEVEGLGCDTATPLRQMRALADQTGVAVQGNLDPLLLAAGGPQLDARVRGTLAAMRGAPFIFNLGHGIVPHTPPEHVARLVELVRSTTTGA
ncbi:MAG: uroporphyrinogen decarboxylase [Hyphomicrobium sp.]|uniref:uroporphyrinogen decarboxylase n=1 Tax=Hyphomicrobium sp. TaxID=82 RepID=UPI00132B06AE|nr:uroporphyrinogen decarboxylase [Hyphomicrobium sp.]KAB2944126.1 MAG: uroporphyrinogen decarboxylase [Hyphomicrobium sp.]MBZ0209425.1 uroporphyrinogen decarboxylase [Hyphomicrobium sp.]MCZ7593943.1 uroporphyrinogen decarboxylase [Hyphomicrobium sp.]